MRRIFIGIKADSILASEIVSWQEKHDKNLKVRWTSENNLHLTLVPPWYEEESNIKNQISKLSIKSLDIKSFFIEFNLLRFGPVGKTPRLIWAEGCIPDRLLTLKSNIENSLEIISEKREFKFHMTLGRFKEQDFNGLKNRIKIGIVFWKMKVDSFHLFESKLSPAGAEYKVLKEIKL